MENERDDKAADKEWLLNLLLGTEEAQKERMAVQVAVPSKQIQETFQAVIDEASNGTQLQSLLCLLRTHRVLHNGRSLAMILFEWACRNFPNVAFLQDCVDIRNSEDDTGIVGTQMLTMVTSLPLWDQPRFQGWTPMQQLSEFHRMLNLFEVDISPRSPVHSSPNYTFQHINGMIFTYRCKHFHLFAAGAVAKMTGSKENLTAFGNPVCRVVGCTHEATKGKGGYCGKKACMASLKCPYCGNPPRMCKKNGGTVAYPNYADHSCRSCRDKGMHKKA